MVRGTAPAEAAWINDASARSSCGTECAALERARTAPELLFPGWPSNGAHCPPVPPAQDNPYRGAAACADVECKYGETTCCGELHAHFVASCFGYPPRASAAQQLKLWNISYSEGAAPCLSYTLQQGEVACPKATCYQTGKCWCDSADPNYSGECEVCSRHQGGEGCGD